MSRYDENPFSDPEASNPFNDMAQASPIVSPGATTQNFIPPPPYSAPRTIPTQFPQPSVQLPASSPSNPFGFYDDPSQAKTPVYGSIKVESPGQAPAYMDNARANTDDLRRRQEELERKAVELERREAELRGAPFNARQNNFPPLPHGCCVKPCFYQDFQVDIPLENQKIVKGMYFMWIGYSILLLLNVFACTAYLAQYGTSASSTFGLSILWVVLFTPCSFLLWYRPLYKAFRSDSSLNFFGFFMVFFAQTGVCIVQCLGIDPCGTAGIINGLFMISKSGAANIGVGVFMFVVGMLFACLAIIDALMLLRIHRYYRNTGASFEKAKLEFGSAAMRNEHVQNAAVNAAGRVVQESVSGARF